MSKETVSDTDIELLSNLVHDLDVARRERRMEDAEKILKEIKLLKEKYEGKD